MRWSRWSRICCWTVTSRALVGSSATSSFGRAARPIAIRARCFMPPENSCGNCSARRSASESPASSSSWTVRFLASAPLAMPLAARVSRICAPTFHIGLRLLIGSCGTRPTWSPRSTRISFSETWVMSRPSKRICPPVMEPFSASRCAIAMAVVDLPEPDSPTIATVSPGYTSRFALRTPLTGPFEVVNVISRSLISSSGCAEPAEEADGVGFTEVVVIASSPSGPARRAPRRRA